MKPSVQLTVHETVDLRIASVRRGLAACPFRTSAESKSNSRSTAVWYQPPVHGCGAPWPTVHNGVMLSPHATDAPIAITPAASATTNATRLTAARAS